MKIRFRQTGGIAGLVFGCDLDTSKLNKTDAVALTKLVLAANLEKSLERRSAEGRDLQQYEIVIDRDGKKARLLFDDMTTPTGVQPLLDFLSRRSRAVPLEK